MTEDKKPITTLQSVLNHNELEAFQYAQKTWEELTKESTDRLNCMATVGHAIEILYQKGKTKGLKKPEITKMVNKSFPGLTAIERSELRKLSRNIDHITCFIRDCNIKSVNTSYIVSTYVKAVKEDCQACRDIEKELPSDASDDASDIEKKLAIDASDASDASDVDGANKKTKVVLGDTITKKGFDNIVRPVEPKDIVENFGKVVNQLKTLYNQGKLTTDDKIEIDRHATSLLSHMAGIYADDDMIAL